MDLTLKRIISKVWLLFACLIISFAVIITLLRAMTPWLMRHKSQIKHVLSEKLHKKVTFSRLITDWQGFEPVVRLDNLRITDEKHKNETIFVRHVTIGLDIWHSLIHRQLVPGLLHVDGLNLNIDVSAKPKLLINGFPVNLNRAKPNASFSSLFFEKLKRLEFDNIHIDLIKNKYQLPINIIYSNLLNRQGVYQLTTIIATGVKKTS
ncbi:MAG: hypothetical protein AAGG80_06515, partial [Pseudomonadota bacterium]